MSSVDVPLRFAIERDGVPLFSEKYDIPVTITPPNQSEEFVIRGAVLPAIDGCTANRDSQTVNVRAGVVSPVRLSPRLCGTIVIKARGSDTRNQSVTRELWYSLQPEGSAEPPEQPLPVEGLTKVVPVGKYLLHIRMRQCTPYDETPALEIFAGETISRTAIVLICP